MFNPVDMLMINLIGTFVYYVLIPIVGFVIVMCVIAFAFEFAGVIYERHKEKKQKEKEQEEINKIREEINVIEVYVC